MIDNMKFAKEYFANNEAVTHWWNPESSITANIYKHGLDEVLKELTRFSGIKTVLDAGCGKGRISKELSKIYLVTAVDISDKMLDFVRDLNLSKVKIQRAELESLPFPDCTFDAIVCLETIVHLEDIEKVFREFYRVLKPGGILIVDFDNKYGLIRLIKNFFDYFFIKTDETYRLDRMVKKERFNTLGPKKVIYSLVQAGFLIHKKFFIGLFIPFKLKKATILSPQGFCFLASLNKILEKVPLIRNLATYIYVVCQKQKTLLSD